MMQRPALASISSTNSCAATKCKRSTLLRGPLCILFCTIALSTWSDPSSSNLAPVPHSDLCVTEGSVEQLPNGHLSVRVPKMRAYVNHATPQDVEARFTYLGSTGNEARLKSGELRRQFGLKLRAEDGCNLIYAMWRIEPQSKLVVSIKSNPGQHTSAECTNGGYKNIKPVRSSPVPTLSPGEAHTLHAVMENQELRVFVDDRLVWEGTLGVTALRMEGPVGMRSDNARLDLELLAATPSTTHPGDRPGCRTGPQDTE
jgi:hypothetical protein